MSEPYSIAVIGGGIVGLAAARALRERHLGRIAVLEAEPELARHQTGHNSGVIHSGLYYEPGSLKARNCVRGRELLVDFCRSHGVAHEQCGKLVVATTDAELARLDALEQRGKANGLEGLERLKGRGLQRREPHVAGIEGLWVPQTGIVDFKQVALALARGLREADVDVLVSTRVVGIENRASLFVVRSERSELAARHLLNCAGLQSDRVARMCGLEPGLRIVPFRGEYYELVAERTDLVRNLIYPVPDPSLPFLGVHFTRRIDGRIEAGPNAVLAFSREGYTRWRLSPRDLRDTLTHRGFWRMARRNWASGIGEFYRSCSKRAFVEALRRLVPAIERDDLEPAGAGVRAQAIDVDGSLVDDFRVLEAERMLHVLNAPSPAATASLSIGQTLAEMAARSFG